VSTRSFISSPTSSIRTESLSIFLVTHIKGTVELHVTHIAITPLWHPVAFYGFTLSIGIVNHSIGLQS
jgi:hypothetical protein